MIFGTSNKRPLTLKRLSLLPNERGWGRGGGGDFKKAFDPSQKKFNTTIKIELWATARKERLGPGLFNYKDIL